MISVYKCALCDGQGTLLKLRPSLWYACQGCVRKVGGRDQALLEIMLRLRTLAERNDPRLNHPSVLKAIQSLSVDLRARLTAGRSGQS